MTTIESTDGKVALAGVRPTQAAPELTHIDVRVRGAETCTEFRTAELLAALGATANADVKHRADAYEAATEAEAALDSWRTRALGAERLVEAERNRADAAVAKLERVRRATLAITPTHDPVRVVRRQLIDILNGPKPKPFVLPAEAGVRFGASRTLGGKNFDYEFTTYTTGENTAPVYVRCDDFDTPIAYSATEIMEDFKNHRLIEAE